MSEITQNSAEVWPKVADLATIVAKKLIKSPSEIPDVVQEMHIAFTISYPSSYDGKRPLRAWARGLFTNTARKYYRDWLIDDENVDYVGDLHDAPYATMVFNPEVAYAEKDIVNLIYKVLPVDEADWFVAHFVEGYTLSEIAEKYDVARSTLHYNMNRNFLLVNQKLREDGYDALPEM